MRGRLVLLLVFGESNVSIFRRPVVGVVLATAQEGDSLSWSRLSEPANYRGGATSVCGL